MTIRHTVFYSWEADRPNNTNRGFIGNALEEAVRQLKSDTAIEPVIERDTKGTPGSPDIAKTIFRKIDHASVFVADVTLINDAEGTKRTPNPNVLFELGYALHVLGEDRIILVMNTANGRVEDLPFDLKMRRVITYHVTADEQPKARPRHELASILSEAIAVALDSIPSPAPAPSEVETALAAIEAQAPNRILLINKAVRQLVGEIAQNAPPSFLGGGTIDDLLVALGNTVGAVRAFTLLAYTIAVLDDRQSAIALFKSLGAILERYDLAPGYSGNFDERDFDYWKFLGHELFVSLIAALLQHERYDIIASVLNERIRIRDHNGAKQITFEDLNAYLPSFEAIKRRRLSHHADLLHQRHAVKGDQQSADGPLADILQFDDFMSADYFLFLRGEISPEKPVITIGWVPWTSVWFISVPHFLIDAIRVDTARKLATALGAKDVETLKKRLDESAWKPGQLWGVGWNLPLQRQDIDRIGTQ